MNDLRALPGDRYRMRGKLVHAEKHRNTKDGNPQWTIQIRLNGGPVWGMRTRPDAQCAGLIESHHVGEYVVVTVEDSEIIGYEVTARPDAMCAGLIVKHHVGEPKYTIKDWL